MLPNYCYRFIKLRDIVYNYSLSKTGIYRQVDYQERLTLQSQSSPCWRSCEFVFFFFFFFLPDSKIDQTRKISRLKLFILSYVLMMYEESTCILPQK